MQIADPLIGKTKLALWVSSTTRIYPRAPGAPTACPAGQALTLGNAGKRCSPSPHASGGPFAKTGAENLTLTGSNFRARWEPLARTRSQRFLFDHRDCRNVHLDRGRQANCCSRLRRLDKRASHRAVLRFYSLSRCGLEMAE